MTVDAERVYGSWYSDIQKWSAFSAQPCGVVQSGKEGGTAASPSFAADLSGAVPAQQD